MTPQPTRSRLSTVAGAGFALVALVLAAAVVRCLWVNPDLLMWRSGALGLGLLLGTWRFPYGILAFVFLTPLLGMLPRSLGVNDLSLPEHMLIALLVCGALRLAWSRAPRRASAVDRPLALFMAIVAISATRALCEYRALGPSLWTLVGPQLDHHFSFTIFDYTKGPFLVVHYTVVAIEGGLWFTLLTLPGSVRAAPLRAALVLSAAAVALVGAAQAIWHFQMIAFFEAVQPGLTRINSTLPDPNTLGSFLVLVFPVGVVAALQLQTADDRRQTTDNRQEADHGPCGETPVCRLLSVICCLSWTVLLLYCLIRSVSRTAWVSFAVVALGTAVVAGWRPSALGVTLTASTSRHLRRTLAALLFSTALAVVAVSFGGVGRDIGYRSAGSPFDMLIYTFNVRRSADELVPARFDHWQAAIRIWRDFPLLGAGIGKYALLKNRYLPEARTRWMFFTEAHNYYLKILSELGVVGLAAFLVLLGSIGVQARRAWAVADRAGRQRVAAVVAGLSAFLISSLTQDPLALREMQYVFWAVVALLVLETRETAGPWPLSLGGGAHPRGMNAPAHTAKPTGSRLGEQAQPGFTGLCCMSRGIHPPCPTLAPPRLRPYGGAVTIA